MLGLSELTDLVWNERMLPNDVKENWATVTNSRYMTPLSKYPWIGVDILNLNDLKLTMLLNSIQPYNFTWIPDMRYYLDMWKADNDAIINKLPKEF